VKHDLVQMTVKYIPRNLEILCIYNTCMIIYYVMKFKTEKYHKISAKILISYIK
jgi:hypothetical protein